jgi:hypothetical protein
MKKGAKIAIGIGSAVVGLVVLYFVLKHFGVIGNENKSGAMGMNLTRPSYRRSRMNYVTSSARGTTCNCYDPLTKRYTARNLFCGSGDCDSCCRGLGEGQQSYS